MDAGEKLAALKRAYADMILNISKESAARVMEFDRKSSRYQHELNVAKEEGCRMLVHLKQMMDSKVSEAETTSLTQQQKIEELEAQLQEAIDIVKDLRDELAQVRTEMDKVKNEKSQHVNELENAWASEIQVENVNYSYQSQNESFVAYDVSMPCLRSRNGCEKCYNKIVCTCGVYNGNRELPSIILRSKEVGPYRNGCTQRIRACERNLSDRELSLSGGKGKETLKSPNSMSETETLSADVNLSGSQSFPLKGKRGTRRRKTVITLGPGLPPDKVESCEEERNDEETGLAESLLSLDCKVAVENIETPSNNLEVNWDDIIKSLPSQRVNETAVKYTYQRRHKRQALSVSNVNGSLDEQSCDKKKLVKSKSSLSMESSRDSRRLAQVARQLLSLSEKKWT